MPSSTMKDRQTVMLAATAVAGLAVVGVLLARRLRRRPTFGRYRYPRTRASDHYDKLWDQRVPDPYRWLEDADSEETRLWVKAQNECTDWYLEESLEPERSKFRRLMTEMYNYDKYSCPCHYGPYYFFCKKTGLQPQSVLYKQYGLGGDPEPLLDPNTMSTDGTAALKGYYFTQDGAKIAYGVSYSGADWYTIRVKDVASGADLPDEIKWCKWGNVSWSSGAKGFFYCKYPPPQGAEDGSKSAGTEKDVVSNCRIFYHVLGTAQERDQLVLDAAEDDKWLRSCEVTEDYAYLLITIHDSCDPVNRLYYQDLTAFDGVDVSTIGPLVRLVDTFDHKYQYITNDANVFYFVTNKDAPRSKVVKMVLPLPGSPDESDPKALAAYVEAQMVVIPQDPTAVLEGVYPVAEDKLVLSYMRDAQESLEVSGLDGRFRRPIRLNTVGALEGLFARRHHNELFFKFVNFQDAGTTYRCVVGSTDRRGGGGSGGGGGGSGGGGGAAGPAEEDDEDPDGIKMQIFIRTEVPGIDPDEFEARQVRYRSRDGTSVPMFIVSKKGQRGKAPCLLYGYGGFNIPILPSFNLKALIFIKYFGGRYCVANIRGGGEYGEEWHKAGTKERKQNVFDDFISAADYLCTVKMTTEKQLAIMGASNGGLLVGACANQAPHKFACAVAQVGVMDMLRFHKFTIGHAWCSDYGNADEDEDQFRTLLKYSPVHNVRRDASPYPAMLITTGDHDDRVVPLHSYKYVAALQQTIGRRKGEPNPLLIRIDTKSGHGAGKPTEKIIAEASDIYTFIAKHTGAVWSGPP